MAITYHAGRRIQGLDSEKPIDVSTTEIYNKSTGAASLDLYTAIPRVGIKAVSGNTTGHINKIKVFLRVIGTHTSTNAVYVRVRKISDDSIVATATKTIADLTSGTTVTEYEFDFGSCVEITEAEHYVLVEYAYGDASNYLGVSRHESAVTGWEWLQYSSGAYSSSNSSQGLRGSFSSQVGHLCTSTQVGSRFEETDTRKMYHYESPSVTFEDDFSSSPNGWTLGSGQTIESGYLYADGNDVLSSKPLAIGEPTNFIFDFDYAPVDGAPRITFVVLNSELGGYGAASSGQKRIIFGLHQNGLSMDIRYRISGSSEVEVISVDSTVPPYDGTISYYRMIKTSGNITVKRYASDANRTSDVSVSQTVSLNFTESGYSGTADLAYLVVGGKGSDASYSRNAKLYDFKFYSGVTSLDNVWSEEGT